MNTRDRIINEYFEWMYDLVCGKKYLKKLSYRKLLYFLHNTTFTYTIPMDANRADDGIELRYRFGIVKGYSDAMIADILDTRECSMLEMMVALSNRCEESIMDDPVFGNRTGQWFWNMIMSLGLGYMTDERFEKDIATEIVNTFLNHRYSANGEGGLFTLAHPSRDLRKVEIWYQMMWYLNELLEDKSAAIK